jgi:dimethylaniline monooxygenase (N-oxide forming)
VAGTQVNEKLGWGWEGWKFWWGDRTLYKLIMDGIPTPFVYRLWEGREGGRKTWEGARAEIYKVNGLVAP